MLLVGEVGEFPAKPSQDSPPPTLLFCPQLLFCPDAYVKLFHLNLPSCNTLFSFTGQKTAAPHPPASCFCK